MVEVKQQDNGGRRSGFENRKLFYAVHVPERRFGQKRRNGRDRRNGPRLGPENRADTA